MQPQRRSYSKSFKAGVIQECSEPGASIASVALGHNLNANLVHKWIRLQSQKTVALQPAFIPLTLPSSSTSRTDITASTICLEIPYPRGTVKVNWPAESAAACATFLRDLLR
ncbi:transposase [Pseudomonas sp. Irchel 3A7]|uniref:IS66-like element accessory protein TnpA n=1 Tax=Pseudomonas sp. Irchel 3A7 TaxID=2008913 RepID=UPI0021159DA8|nr:transposase [Pseudomonas sp. Irchel 3A7]